MGALPNYQQPEPRKKQPAKARKPKESSARCEPRTRADVLDDIGRGTNFESGIGFLVLFHDSLKNIARLTSGNVCTLLLLRVFQELSRWGKGSAALATDAELSVPECAAFCDCDERSVNRVLEYLESRGMAMVARLADSKFVIQLSYRDWSEIQPSYREWDEKRRLAEAAAAETELNAEEETEELAAVKAGIVPITTKPHVVKAGHPDRESKVPCGVRTFQVNWEHAGLDLKYRAVVDSGKFIVTACIAETKVVESKQGAKRADSTTSKLTSGHGCPNGTKIPANGGTRKTTRVEVTAGGKSDRKERGSQSILVNPPVQHPRAEELSSLFDPLLLKSCGKSLSGDPSMLLAACEAIGKADHDYLVKSVIERAERELKLVHVKAVCREIAYNWEKSKGMPVPAVPADSSRSKGDARAEQVIKGMKMLDAMRKRKKA